MSAYFRPDSLDDALAVLARGPVTVAAGCTDLFPATEAQTLPGDVLDITAVDALRGVSEDADGWRIGATTTWSELCAAPLPPAFDALKQAAREVGSVQIQNAGSVAGNLCNASPAADGVPPLLVLDATVTLRSARGGTRRLGLDAFLTGARRTARAPDELLTAIHVPLAAGAGSSRFLKLGARRYLVISIAMVAVRVVESGGLVEDIALAVGACSPVATRLHAQEARLRGLPVGALAGAVDPALIAAALTPIADMRADAGYRAEAAAELIRRALRAPEDAA